MIESLLLAILVGLALAAVWLRDLLGSAAVLGAYSLVMALLWAYMNALDVAFTEAAVGAGISTVLMLAAINRIGRLESGHSYGPMVRPALRSIAERSAAAKARNNAGVRRARIWALIMCALVAAALIYGAKDMPEIGNSASPANEPGSVADHYLENSDEEVGSYNIVTSVLGDYRGYDTMGETTVIFTAALCVLLLLRLGRPDEDTVDVVEDGGEHAD